MNKLQTLGANNLSNQVRADWDFYSTDPQAVNDLLIKVPELRNCKSVLEPCAGMGDIADRFTELTKIPVDKYDIISRREDIIEQDYMKLKCNNKYDLIITNFPYKEATKKDPNGFSELLNKTLNDVMPGGYVCSFQRLLYLTSKKRYEKVYGRRAPEQVLVYSYRINCYKNGDTNVNYNSAVDYCWCIWHKDKDGFYRSPTTLKWIY